MQPTRIVLYGNFGAGNLGNECTLQTAIEQTLRRLPQANLVCVCPDPEDVRVRHNIAAAPSLAQNLGWSWSDLDSKRFARAQHDISLRNRGQANRGPVRRLVGKLARLCRIVAIRAPQELVHWCKMLRVLARSDVLLVPGTGIVTDDSCGSFGWPYDMFKLTVLATLCNARIVFLSVGAGPFRYRLGSWFIRQSLGSADYRSYRDIDSKRRLENIGFNTANDMVYPDLVFGLSHPLLTAKRTQNEPARIIGLGLKDYATPIDEADAQSYRDYLGVMADFVTWLQAQHYTVRLIIGDAQYDTRVRKDLIELLRTRSADTKDTLLLSEPVPTVDELLRQLRETDAVVSPRFHNLVLALMLNKPVIALSDLPKIDALLGDLGLGRFCLALEGLKSEELINRFAQLQNDAENLQPYIRELVKKYHDSVDQQYDEVYRSTAKSLAAISDEAGVPTQRS